VNSQKTPSLWFIHGLMLFTAALVSTSFTVGKAIADDIDPIVLTLIRFCVAVIIFLPYVKNKYGIALPSRYDLLRYSAISLTMVTFFVLMFFSLQYTTALNTGVVFTLVPGISGLFSWIFLKERLGKYSLISLVVAMFGAALVLLDGDINGLLALQLNKGDLIFALGCLFISLYTPLVKLLYRGESMTVMTFWILVTGCGWLLIPALPRLLEISWTTVPVVIWASIVYLAVFCTIITFFLSQWATLHLGPTRVMAYSYLYPPMILAIDWASGHGTPPFSSLVGIIIIIFAMFVVQKG
jgi:drug/metabolite transporter (DMT)-like permease